MGDPVTDELLSAVRSIPLDDQMLDVVSALDTVRLHLDSIAMRPPGLPEATHLHRLCVALYGLQHRATRARDSQLRRLQASGLSALSIAKSTGIERTRVWKLIKGSRRSDHGNGRGRAGDHE